MADVLLVYVQEDRAYAEGIGASLERSGLTVADGDGSAHTGAEALCVLVLWSAHSTRSAIVRDVAIRAQREGKLITAKLAGCEAPLGFARPAPHDLSQWMGDPDDPLLDPLFFAADRLVCAVRLNARPDPLRAETRPPQQIYPQGGHIHGPNNVRPLRAGPIASVGPSAARAARVEPDSASHAQQRAEPALPPNVAQEAAAWKRIEHSTDPKDFLDYLTTFSPNGIFCELAQLKLDKLTPKTKAAFIPHTPSPHVPKPRAAEGTRERRNAARTQPPPEARPPEPEPPRYAPRADPRPDPRDEQRYEARPEPRPDPRYDPRPDPRYEPRPEVRPDPRYEQQRPEARYDERAEPRYEPRPRPRPESREDYEFESGPLAPARSATNRPRRRAPAPQQVRYDAREGGGIPWRPIMIVALLAAGGVAFFQALPKQAPQSAEIGAPGQDMAEASRAAPLDELTAPGDAAPPPLGSGTAALGAVVPGQRTAAARPAPAPAARPAYQQPAATAPRPQTPAPTPIISFLPPQQPVPAPAPITAAPQPAPAAVVQPAPQPAPAPPATVSATPGPVNSGNVRPTWLRRPGAAQLASAYPRRAVDAGVNGQAQLDCLIGGDGSLACSAISSSPANYGFAQAGLAVARYFRAAPTLPDGSSAYGKRTTLTIRFASEN